MGYVPCLPQEILLLIFEFIGETSSLMNVLLTSRQFYNMAESILYQNVVIDDAFNFIPHLITNRFMRNITADTTGRRAALVHTLVLPQCVQIHTIFPSLTNIRRLAFTDVYHLEFEQDAVWASLRPLSHLTHLMWRNPIRDLAAFNAFIQAQPSLEYLNFMGSRSKTLGINVSPNALPLLHTLMANVVAALPILTGRQVKHLELYTTDEDLELDLDNPSFRIIESLACSDVSWPRLAIISACFPALKYLELHSRYDHSQPETIATALRPLGATQVEYISLLLNASVVNLGIDVNFDKGEGRLQPVLTSAVIATFKDIPSLRILEFIPIGCPGRSLRYRRDLVAVHGPIPFKRLLRKRTSWDLWWQGCKPDY